MVVPATGQITGLCQCALSNMLSFLYTTVDIHLINLMYLQHGSAVQKEMNLLEKIKRRVIMPNIDFCYV